jgi:hypothetical protein
VLQEGENYQYKEGSYIRDVQLISVVEEEEWWQFKLLFLEESRVDTINFHKEAEGIAFMSMWIIYDQGTFDIEKAEQDRRELTEKAKDVKLSRLDIDFDE